MSGSNVVVPSLSEWITDPKKKLNTQFAYALTADYSQSTNFNGKVTSIPWLIATYQNNQAELANEMEVALRAMYYDMFDSVTVNISYDTPVNATYNLYISIEVMQAGNSYDLAIVGQVDNGVLKSVLNQINTN